MNKSELIDLVAENAAVSRTVSENVLNAVMDSISETLSRGESIVLTGFGTYSVSKREARTGRNPQTGQPLQIPERMVPVFKAGKTLKEAVQNAEVDAA